ncbi:MAG: HDOD domain-containing protein [Betaproteobacteria bacterium]|nr:HDOD domain-containing protein [Betaproteobacteria bacterium]
MLDDGTETLDRSAEEIAHENGIPPCPVILTRLLRETRADEPDARRIGRFVTGDVGLAAAILRIANSPFYGLRTKAASVHQALALLGIRAVTQLVTGLLLRQAFPAAAGRGMERYWKASTASALIAALVSRETRAANAELAHTYVLFRDCDMALMLRRFADYGDIMEGTALAAGAAVPSLESRRYGINHSRIGAQLARTWQLSGPVCGAILDHHEIAASALARDQAEPESCLLVAVGLAAERIYCAATGTVCREWAGAAEWVLPVLRIDQDALEEFAVRVKASLDHV